MHSYLDSLVRFNAFAGVGSSVKDAVALCGPLEWLRVLIVFFEAVADGFLKGGKTLDDTASDAP